MKKWYQSKSLQGNIISAIGLIVQLLKLPVVTDEVSSGVSALFLLVGIGYAVYGRIVTKGEKLN